MPTPNFVLTRSYRKPHVRAGGLVVIGTQTLLYMKDQFKRSIALPPATHITAYGAIDTDGRRWLLGDSLGGLHMLLLRTGPQGTVVEIQLQRLGEVRGVLLPGERRS